MCFSKGFPFNSFSKGFPFNSFSKGFPTTDWKRHPPDSSSFVFLFGKFRSQHAAGGGIPLKNKTDFGWRFSGGVLFLLPLPKGEGKDIYYDAIVIMGWDGR